MKSIVCKLFIVACLATPLIIREDEGDPLPVTIEEWCTTLSGTPNLPRDCVPGLPNWTCHTAVTQPWCCVRKEITYTCPNNTYIDVVNQWNQANAHCAT